MTRYMSVRMHDLLSFVDGSPYLFLGIPALTFLTRGVVKLFLCCRFSKAIQGLPFGQVTSIWNIFCDEIVENYLTKISSLTEAALVKKKKKSSSLLEALLRSLEYVSSVFSAFLVNISFGGIGEHAKKRSSMSSIGTLLLRTVTDVVDPLFETSLKEAQETVSIQTLAILSG